MTLFTQVVPRDKQESPDEAKMFEEGIGGHEALRSRHFPKAVSDEGSKEGEARKRQCA